jgi:hypothetical protein
MKGALLSKADDPVCPASKFFPLGQSRLDPFVLKQRDQHIAKHQFSMLSVAT